MVLVILLPLSKILISFDNVKEYINDITHNIKTEEIINNSNELIITNSEKKICDGIKEMIITKFHFDTTDILVELVCNKNDINSIKIEAVNVILTNKASWSNVDSVKEYLDQNLGCKVNVTRR